MTLLNRTTAADFVPRRGSSIDAHTLARASDIIERVRAGRELALLDIASSLGDLAPDAKAVYTREDLAAAERLLPVADRDLLHRVANRIRAFAMTQRASLRDLDMPVLAGRAGHTIAPVDSAGCYAPGGRFPLPSSVLMTAVTARAAGVPRVVVASPRPTPATLAAASIAGADALLAIGGAQAVAALALGILVPACDVIAGPGNRYVTAAKKLVAGEVGIDMLAGPSELTILADESADPALVAADLLAQAEHDDDAVPILVTTSYPLADRVEAELESQLASLPTAATARRALANGAIVLAPSLESAANVCNAIAPEHLEVIVSDEARVVRGLRHYGAIFFGGLSAEVFGDYGVGPNHTLPTGGTARFSGGLSVFNFLRVRTWMKLDALEQTNAHDNVDQLIEDSIMLARIEGLEAHARAAEKRAAR
ncbi:MAG: histidinol dehydrogenase [Phycisphaerae bacterium]|nr:histidinol dehydrogenase [Phycisphaerae bacterium]